MQQNAPDIFVQVAYMAHFLCFPYSNDPPDLPVFMYIYALPVLCTFILTCLLPFRPVCYNLSHMCCVYMLLNLMFCILYVTIHKPVVLTESGKAQTKDKGSFGNYPDRAL